MGCALARLAFVLMLVGMALPAAVQAGGPKPRIDPSFPPLYGGDPNRGGGAPPAYRPAPPPRPAIACDPYGRCWRQLPRYGYGDRFGGTRPPGWADDLPDRGQTRGRFSRPRSGVVCDQASRICYKRGRIDKSETRAAFGDRAADRADDLRDERGTARLFVPERGITCDPGRRVCFDDGVPDFSLTRRYFGRRAAEALD